MRQERSKHAASMHQAGSKQAASMQQERSMHAVSTQQKCSKRAARTQQACSKHATSRQQAGSKRAASRQQVCSKNAASMQQTCSKHAAIMQQAGSKHATSIQHATCSRHGFCYGSGAAGFRRHHVCKLSQTAFAHHRSFGILAGAAGQPPSRWLARSLLLLSSRPAPFLRAYAILNYTLGVGQIRLRGVGFTIYQLGA